MSSSLPSAPDLDSVRAQLDALSRQLRPLAKARPVSLRDTYVSKSHAAFVEAVDAMLAEGTAKRQIAREMDIDVHTLIDVYEGKRRLQAWMIAALPARARVVFFRAALLWTEERNGTDG